MTKVPVPKGVHTIKRRRPGGKVQLYRYYRPTKVRLYSEPGTLTFAAEVERAKRAPGPFLPNYVAPSEGKRPRFVYVYFVQAKALGLIKIGKAADPRARMKGLQIGCPDEIEFLGAIEDQSGGALEVNLHAAFAKHRVRGEWFRPHPEILEFIEKRALVRLTPKATKRRIKRAEAA